MRWGFQGAAGQGMHPKANEGSVFYKTRMCHRSAFVGVFSKHLKALE